MPNKSFTPEGIQWAFDATSLSDASSCMFKYYMHIVMGYKTKDSSGNLIFGGLFAAALEHFYLETSGKFDDRVADTLHYVLKQTYDWEVKAPIAFQAGQKTRFTLCRAVVQYLDYYEKNPGEHAIKLFHLADGSPAIELSFTVEIPDTDIVLCGHEDRIVEYADAYFWMDQKTTNMKLTPFFFNMYNPSMQTFLYTYVGPIVLDVPISGGIIDGVSVTASGTEFARQTVPVNHLLMDEWLEDTKLLIEQIKEANHTGHYRRNFNACRQFGRCNFYDYCHGTPGLRQAELETNFTQPEPWDPISRQSAK